MDTPQTERIRVLLVDDHAIVRQGLRMLLESRPRMQVVGEAATGEDALALIDGAPPDIVLLDLDLAGQNGLDLIPAIYRAAPRTRVIVLTGLRDAEAHQQAVRLGAMGVVLKDQASETLVTAIETVHSGESWLDRALTARMLHRMAEASPEQARIGTLTAREREVIQLIAEGLSNRAIGERLHLSESTVRHHLTSIFDKLDVESRLELVIYAYRNGLGRPT
jgi:two-component system, NarL family, nitrate/nitrite response regulator NarL